MRRNRTISLPARAISLFAKAKNITHRQQKKRESYGILLPHDSPFCLLPVSHLFYKCIGMRPYPYLISPLRTPRFRLGFFKLKFVEGERGALPQTPPPLKRWTKLLQNGSAQTSRHFEPRDSMRKRERALFVRFVTHGVHVLCALAQRTKMTQKTSSILLLQTSSCKKNSFSPKVFGGCRGLFSKSPLHVLPSTNFNL